MARAHSAGDGDAVREKLVRRRPEENRRDQTAGRDRAHQGCARFQFGDVDENDPDDRAENGNSAENKWINNRRRIARDGERADQNRADQTDRVSFENVRRHAGAIADIIADVIGDRGRIARIIFFETALDFSDKIRADVRGFCVNTAAESRENADQTRAQGETDQAADCAIMSHDEVEKSDCEKGKTDDEQVR